LGLPGDASVDAATDPEGAFTLDGIAAAYPGYSGVYPLTATAEGHATVTLVGRCRLTPG